MSDTIETIVSCDGAFPCCDGHDWSADMRSETAACAQLLAEQQKRLDAQARAERAEGVLEAVREHCQSRHDFARAALIEAGNEQDRGHYRGQRDSLRLVLDKLDLALTPAPQGRTDGERDSLIMDLSVARSQLAEANEKIDILRTCDDAAFLEWLLANCKIIHWPGGGHYPIEHAPAAKKDSVWLLKMAMNKQGMYAQDAPAPEVKGGGK